MNLTYYDNSPMPVWGLLQISLLIITILIILGGIAYFSNKTDWDKEVLKK